MASDDAGLIGRRQFLTRGALAGAGLVMAPSVIAACSTGTASKAPSAAPSAAPSVAITPNLSTSLKEFKPFAPSDKTGTKPPVPNVFVYSIPEASEYFNGLSKAAETAAKERGIQYDGEVISDGDPVKNIDQLNQLLQKGIGGIWIQPEDSPAQGVVIEKGIPQGVCMVFSGHPATIQGMADQYDLGYQQALGAVQWIKDNLGGKATVMNFILDHIEILIPRRQGTLDALKTGGAGITILEQELQKINTDEGFEFASTALQAHPEINVWIGPDDTVLGVDAFLKSKSKDPAKEKVLATGLNGTDAGLAALKSNKSFIRQIYGFNSNLIGYAIGNYMADWFLGKQVPQVIQGRGVAVLSPADVDTFNALIKDYKAGYTALQGGDTGKGLAAWGAINYDTRMNYTKNAITG